MAEKEGPLLGGGVGVGLIEERLDTGEHGAVYFADEPVACPSCITPLEEE